MDNTVESDALEVPKKKLVSDCAVMGCDYNRSKEHHIPGIQRHYFPRNELLCLRWMSFCQNPIVNSKTPEDLSTKQSHFICSQHFDALDYYIKQSDDMAEPALRLHRYRAIPRFNKPKALLTVEPKPQSTEPEAQSVDGELINTITTDNGPSQDMTEQLAPTELIERVKSCNECAVNGCDFNRKKPYHKNGITCHFFPKNKLICMKWMSFCRNTALLSKTPEELSMHRTYFICSQHFSNSDSRKANKPSTAGQSPVDMLNDAADDIISPIMSRFVPILSKPEAPFRGEHQQKEKPTNPEPKQKTGTVDDIQVQHVSKKNVREYKKLPEDIKKLRLKVHNLQRINNRLRAAAENIRFTRKYYKEMSLQYIKSVLNPVQYELVLCIVTNASRSGRGCRYTQKMKNICLGLYQCSPKAYENLRDVFGCLPSYDTLNEIPTSETLDEDKETPSSDTLDEDKEITPDMPKEKVSSKFAKLAATLKKRARSKAKDGGEDASALFGAPKRKLTHAESEVDEDNEDAPLDDLLPSKRACTQPTPKTDGKRPVIKKKNPQMRPRSKIDPSLASCSPKKSPQAVASSCPKKQTISTPSSQSLLIMSQPPASPSSLLLDTPNTQGKRLVILKRSPQIRPQSKTVSVSCSPSLSSASPTTSPQAVRSSSASLSRPQSKSISTPSSRSPLIVGQPLSQPLPSSQQQLVFIKKSPQILPTSKTVSVSCAPSLSSTSPTTSLRAAPSISSPPSRPSAITIQEPPPLVTIRPQTTFVRPSPLLVQTVGGQQPRVIRVLSRPVPGQPQQILQMLQVKAIQPSFVVKK
ncbi:uncharacterized protein LOC132198536 isoform X2 [Neocloeon triangulifer]|uniref:uncharacterized protein LOC132198536 isoform X2 n=1 Tax=Neocloeon triangulifer TaxID=2078957 RepID=UPI00286F952B|nr:uncharacterized protein LOC132198536 isoform X2 [Neocloeon triangulifer]